ncbi:histone-lysine N-methyltransferase NSD3 isoform X3 [Daktulosphaira vitifoliae]|uniref:histone-lysine N-methyltransferase NSD3 isoform X3 n=1 Tax=Daktulosphaira vitifoliae TaxID=58002 RepID=UPI0021AA298A|nr:histone-lysine N-methyltransferase NSD3 isoform X3 [Daktulosphaira vitifoliae]
MAELDDQIDVPINSNHCNNEKSIIDSVREFSDDQSSADKSIANKILLNQTLHEKSPMLSPEKEIVHDDDLSLIDSNSEKKLDNNFNIGDVVWAKIGKYPFWPSVVCYDPNQKIYYKESKKVKKYFELHVRFCNDQGRRSWAKTVEKYLGKEALLKKYPSCLPPNFKSNKKAKETWNVAVEEADNLLKFDPEQRILEFFKTFCDASSDDIQKFSLNIVSEPSSVEKVRTYSRKRHQAPAENEKKKIKTEKIPNSNSISSKSIDISIHFNSDEIDTTISDISMSYVYIENLEQTFKNEKPWKTYPPKCSINNGYNSSDSECDDKSDLSENDSIVSSDNEELLVKSNSRTVPESRKHQINALENIKNIKEIKNSKSFKKELSSKSSPQKKNIGKHKNNEKDSINKRNKSKSESSPEPDTTESETSSKNETYSSVFLASQKNKQLFVKIPKKACVICEKFENTLICSGTCQNYFHKECLDKSRDKHNSSDQSILEAKHQARQATRSKRQYSKINRNDNIVNSNGLETVIEDKNLNIEDNVDESLNNQLIPDENKNNDNLDNDQSIEDKKNKNVNDKLVIKTTDNLNNESFNKLEAKSENGFLTGDLDYMCNLCRNKRINCFSCGLCIDKNSDKKYFTCKLASCGKVYHEKCLDEWPQCQWIQGFSNNNHSIICPHHVCHLCISDNPKSKCKIKFSAEKLIRCIRCPTAYHKNEYCLPAGCQVLTSNNIVCSRHYEPPKGLSHHINSTWCFICTLGGSLVCCDLCPSSFHVECLNLPPSKFEEGFTCEECQTGRYPLYGEIVWAKIGAYRWWPAQIVFPNQVPDSVNTLPHSIGQFVVRFFGTYKYYWVNRGRVFNFHEGDDENMLVKNKMNTIEQAFQDAIIEAAQAHNAYIIDKDRNDAKIINKSSKKPPKFTKIKFNKPVGNVKNMECNLSVMTSCECDPTKPDPCGPGSDCINRMLMFECDPRLCPAGDRCQNQRFEKTLYPAMEPFLTNGRGWGLKTLEDIKEGSFVIEYVGEVIDEEEFRNRCYEMQKQNEQNYYFLTIDHNRMIDAGPKGNLSRFMNHSCEPNCFTQKWTVNGDTRIGLFALHDIPAGTELVFDYRLESCSGVEKKPCQCGATRCSKFIGVKVEKEEEKKKLSSVTDTDKCKSSVKNKRKSNKHKVDTSDTEKCNGSKKSKEKLTKKQSNTPKILFNIFQNENIKNSDLNISKEPLRKSTGNTNTSKDVPSTETKNHISTRTLRSSLLESNTTLLDTDKNILSRNKVKIQSSKILITAENDTGLCNVEIVKNSPSKIFNVKEFSNFEHGHKNNKYNDKQVVTKQKKDEIMIKIRTSQDKNLNIDKEAHFKYQKEDELNIAKTSELKTGSRHSLTRLAKSRHSFLSKSTTDDNNMKKKTILTKKILKNEKNSAVNIVTIQSKNNKHKKIQCTKKMLAHDKMNKVVNKNVYINDNCLICGKGRSELICKNKKCSRVFHLSCMNKSKVGKSGFTCPSHFCSTCKVRKVIAKCKFCIESFCVQHIKGNIFKDPLGNGMLCTTHHPDKKLIPKKRKILRAVKKSTKKVNTRNICISNVSLETNISTNTIPDNHSSLPIVATSFEINNPTDSTLDLKSDISTEENYVLTEVIKDECDREYRHIGGFNVCNVTDLVIDQESNCLSNISTTDGDMFKPSTHVVIDIESASAFFQPTDSLELVSFAEENKDTNNYANVEYIPESKAKWLSTAEP